MQRVSLQRLREIWCQVRSFKLSSHGKAGHLIKIQERGDSLYAVQDEVDNVEGVSHSSIAAVQFPAEIKKGSVF